MTISLLSESVKRMTAVRHRLGFGYLTSKIIG